MKVEFPNSLTVIYDGTTEKLSRVNPFVLIGVSVAGTWLFFRIREIWQRSDQPLFKRVSAYSFSLVRKLPPIKQKIDAEMRQTNADLVEMIHECDERRHFVHSLPPVAPEFEHIMHTIENYQNMGKFDFLGGRVSGAVYTNMQPGHMNLLGSIFRDFAYSNPLHPDIFPAVRKMEAEVVRIVANLFNGSPESAGTMTSGGTESIILACLASRNYAQYQGITNPIIVVPETAHAAFDKACALLKIRIRHVRCDRETGKVDLNAMKRAIDRNTCLLVGSAPNFPYGSIDDIPAIAELGVQYSIPVHVDACLGGFILAFSEETPALSHVPIFDFRLPGVTSISCDTHKYGYAPKGTSVIVYRSRDLLHHQFFCVPEWPGGIYATPTLSGSRPGLNIALTWATIMYFGRAEYVRRAHMIAYKTAQLADLIEKIPGLYVVGRADVSVVAFSSREFNIHAVADKLSKIGWNLNSLQSPDAIHFCLTYNQTGGNVILDFLRDLRKTCDEVAELPDKGKNSKTAALYGMAAQIPDKTMVEEIAHMYLDACYSMPPKHNNNLNPIIVIEAHQQAEEGANQTEEGGNSSSSQMEDIDTSEDIKTATDNQMTV